MHKLIAHITSFIMNVVNFFAHDLWTLDFNDLSRYKRSLARRYQEISLSIKGFTKNRIGREAVALSFFTTMATVPMVAAILFVSNGFGLTQLLSDMLYKSFPTSTDLIGFIVNMANNIVAATEKGAFGWISFISFIWLVFWLMINIEIAFNRIWKVKQQRKIWKRVAVYMTILLMTPFVLLLFLFGWGYYAKFIGILEGKLGVFTFVTKNIFWLIFYVVAVFALSMMYKFIPHARISYRSALYASLASGAAFVVVQYLYMGTQMMVTRISAVYGVLAFIPLFMVWINICWQIILFGAELSRASQLIEEWEAAENGEECPEMEEKKKYLEAQQ